MPACSRDGLTLSGTASGTCRQGRTLVTVLDRGSAALALADFGVDLEDRSAPPPRRLALIRLFR